MSPCLPLALLVVLVPRIEHEEPAVLAPEQQFAPLQIPVDGALVDVRLAGDAVQALQQIVDAVAGPFFGSMSSRLTAKRSMLRRTRQPASSQAQIEAVALSGGRRRRRKSEANICASADLPPA